MKRTVIVLVVGLLVGSGLTLLGRRIIEGRETTVTRLSPDETIRARLLETSPSWGLDRNFRLQIENRVDRTTTTLLNSPDEGRPEGTERLIWSKDGKWLLLVGRHFFVKEDLFLDNGDQLYFLHHLPSGKSWHNSAEPSRFPALKADTIQGIEFTEPINLKPLYSL